MIYKREHEGLRLLRRGLGAVMPYLYFLGGPSKPHSPTHSSVQYIYIYIYIYIYRHTHPSPSTLQAPKYLVRPVKKTFGAGVLKRGHRERRQKATLPGRSRTPPTFPFTCTTACGLWYVMLIHLWNSGLNPAVSKTDTKNRWSTLSKALD